jgi:Fe-S cluster assembly iron-binding protein IscA
MLELSDSAVREIKELTSTGGLRFEGIEAEDGSVRFDPSIEEQPQEGDEVVERGGARVFLDAVAAAKLADRVLEIESHDDHVHFDFPPQAGSDEGDEASDAVPDGGPDDDPIAA